MLPHISSEIILQVKILLLVRLPGSTKGTPKHKPPRPFSAGSRGFFPRPVKTAKCIGAPRSADAKFPLYLHCWDAWHRVPASAGAFARWNSAGRGKTRRLILEVSRDLGISRRIVPSVAALFRSRSTRSAPRTSEPGYVSRRRRAVETRRICASAPTVP